MENINEVAAALHHPKPRKVYSWFLLIFILLLFSGCKSRHPVSQSSTPVSPNENATTAFNRGMNYYDQQNYDKAIEEFTQAIQLDPKYAKAYKVRGIAYYRKSAFDQSISDFNKSIQLNPKEASAYNNRGLAYDGKKEFSRAITDYTQAINLNPTYANAYNNRGFAYEALGKYDQAITDFNQAIQLDAKSSHPFYNLGNIYQAKGEFDLAISEYNQAISINPNYIIAYIARSSIYIAKGQYSLAIKDLEHAKQLNRDVKILLQINKLLLSIPEDYSKVNNPYNLSLKSIQRKDGLVSAEFCFNLPSDAIWNLETIDGFGEAAGYQVMMITDKDTFEVIAWNDSKENKLPKKGELKCETVEFQPPDSVDLSGSKIIVNKLVIPIPEKPDCKKVQAKIDQLHPGFVVYCEISGNGYSIGLTSGPGDVSQGQAYTYLDDALHDNVVYGPWIFSTGFSKK